MYFPHSIPAAELNNNAVALIPATLESKLGASFSNFQARVPPLWGLSPPSFGLLVEGIDCPVNIRGPIDLHF